MSDGRPRFVGWSLTGPQWTVGIVVMVVGWVGAGLLVTLAGWPGWTTPLAGGVAIAATNVYWRRAERRNGAREAGAGESR